MTFNLSAKSKERLNGVHPDLAKVMHMAIGISSVDFGISQGKRTQAEQDALYEQGRDGKGGKIVTWTRNSRHVTGHAVDVVAFIDGKVSWDESLYTEIAKSVLDAAFKLNIPIDWGGQWSTPDKPHFELDREFYP